MDKQISQINENFDEIKTLFVQLEEDMSILLVGKLICSDDLDDISNLVSSIENKIIFGKNLIKDINFDKKNTIEEIYEKYSNKIVQFKKIFNQHFLYE